MRGLHENQKRLLNYLLEHPDGATLEELAAHLEITKTAAKEHLLKVENLGYISFVDIRGKVGRPRRRYLLSPEGHEAFPRQYSWLSNALLKYLAENMGKASVSQMMRGLAEQVAKSMSDKFKSTNSSAELLVRLTEILSELGYRASLRQSDLRKGAIIEATNCVYHSVAKEHPELCGFDVTFIEKASGLNVKLVTCIARGDKSCRFCLKRK